MIEINGTIKDIEGNIIEDDIPICIEIEVNPKNGRKTWYGSFKTSKTLTLSKRTQNCKIELKDGRSGEIAITHQNLSSKETKFTNNGVIE